MKNKERKEIIEALYKLREEKIEEMISCQNKLNILSDSIDDLNRAICRNNGHTFTSWEEVPNKEKEHDWYFTRRCTTCNKEEKTYEMPEEFIIKDVFTGKVYKLKKHLK